MTEAAAARRRPARRTRRRAQAEWAASAALRAHRAHGGGSCPWNRMSTRDGSPWSLARACRPPSKDECQLRAPLPVCAVFRLNEVVVGGEAEIDRQLSEPEHAARAAADRNRPLCPRRLPV